MTERSYVWELTITGDAVLAPYNAEEWNTFYFGKELADENGGYVVPGYLQDLEVVGAGPSGVYVRPGAAFCKNRLFILDEQVTLPIEYDDGIDYRFDAIVLRYDFEENRVRLAVNKGKTLFVFNQLERTEFVWEVLLAYVVYQGGEVDIQDYDVMDHRRFIEYGYPDSFSNIPQNMVTNSELIAWSDSAELPEYWEERTAGTINRVSTPTGTLKERGWGLGLEGGLEIEQTLTCQPDTPKTLTVAIDATRYGFAVTNYFYSLWVTLEAYDVNGVLLESRSQRVFSMTRKFTTTFTAENIDHYKIAISAVDDVSPASTGTLYSIGVYPGYFANLQPTSETLWFNDGITDVSWGSLGSPAAKSTGTTTIDFAVDFGGNIPLGYVKGVILKVTLNDSGSAAGAGIGFAVGPTTPGSNPAQRQWITLDGKPNNYVEVATLIANTYADAKDGTNSAPECTFEVAASGAGTLDIVVEAIGIIT